ncbi:hypothetical protein PQX77_003649 [Marasmius sp. AFHP31]|nr:hypothetical protein PQX77_003649 [Marasmius sp. AFHP31]
MAIGSGSGLEETAEDGRHSETDGWGDVFVAVNGADPRSTSVHQLHVLQPTEDVAEGYYTCVSPCPLSKLDIVGMRTAQQFMRSLNPNHHRVEGQPQQTQSNHIIPEPVVTPVSTNSQTFSSCRDSVSFPKRCHGHQPNRTIPRPRVILHKRNPATPDPDAPRYALEYDGDGVISILGVATNDLINRRPSSLSNPLAMTDQLRRKPSGWTSRPSAHCDLSPFDHHWRIVSQFGLPGQQIALLPTSNAMIPKESPVKLAHPDIALLKIKRASQPLH